MLSASTAKTKTTKKQTENLVKAMHSQAPFDLARFWLLKFMAYQECLKEENAGFPTLFIGKHNTYLLSEVS